MINAWKMWCRIVKRTSLNNELLFFSKLVSEMGSSVDRLSPGPFASSLLGNVSRNSAYQILTMLFFA